MLCIDDKNVREILPFVSKPVTTYGFHEDADVRAVDAYADGTMMVFTALQKGHDPLAIRLNQPGMHNVQNACAVIAIARELDVNDAAIQRAMENFTGVNRRFTRLGKVVLPKNDGTTAEVELVDDYGHHPAEMAATIAAARGAYPGKRLVLAFQPHRYTRTRDLFEDFVRVLSKADVLLLSEVYPAGEQPIVAADGRTLSRTIRLAGKVNPVFVEDINDMPKVLLNIIQDGDVVMTMGAGSITSVASQLREKALN